MNNWQPIETAPRDGTWVLICGHTKLDTYDQGDVVPPMVVARSREGYEPWERIEWEFAQFDDGLPICVEDPTKWMPLPDPGGDAK